MSNNNEKKRGHYWAMSLASIVTVMESKNLANCWEIGGFNDAEISREWARNCSKKLYGIESREDLLECVDGLTDTGHSASMRNGLTNLPDDPTKDNYRQRLVRNNAEEVHRCGCMAWDIGRAAVIAGWSHLGGYITEDEYWQLIKPMAQRIQRTYSSWQEYANGYELGRLYWAEGAEHPPTTDAIATLLNEPKSPWLKMAWQVDLDVIVLPGQTNASESTATTDNNSEAEIFPGQPVSRLSDYVKLMRMAQNGQMAQAMTELNIDMMAYAQIMQRWSQKMATDTQLAIKFSQMMSGV